MHSAFARDPSNYMRLRQNASPKSVRACEGTRRARCADQTQFVLPAAYCAVHDAANKMLLPPSTAWPSSTSAVLARRVGQPERPARQHADTPVPHASARPIAHFEAQMGLSRHPGQTVRLPGERKIRMLRNRASRGSWGTRFGSCEAGGRHPGPPDGAAGGVNVVPPKPVSIFDT